MLDVEHTIEKQISLKSQKDKLIQRLSSDCSNDP